MCGCVCMHVYERAIARCARRRAHARVSSPLWAQRQAAFRTGRWRARRCGSRPPPLHCGRRCDACALYRRRPCCPSAGGRGWRTRDRVQVAAHDHRVERAAAPRRARVLHEREQPHRLVRPPPHRLVDRLAITHASPSGGEMANAIMRRSGGRSHLARGRSPPTAYRDRRPSVPRLRRARARAHEQTGLRAGARTNTPAAPRRSPPP